MTIPDICDDLAHVPLEDMPAGGCFQCEAIGDTWVHLRYCISCKTTRCCEDSKNQHALKHYHADGHPVIRSKEPGEAWAWCYEHETALRLAKHA